MRARILQYMFWTRVTNKMMYIWICALRVLQNMGIAADCHRLYAILVTHFSYDRNNTAVAFSHVKSVTIIKKLLKYAKAHKKNSILYFEPSSFLLLLGNILILYVFVLRWAYVWNLVSGSKSSTWERVAHSLYESYLYAQRYKLRARFSVKVN